MHQQIQQMYDLSTLYEGWGGAQKFPEWLNKFI